MVHTHTHTRAHTHTPTLAYEQEDVTVLWNQSVHTDREVTANRPDIIIKKKREREKTWMLIDVAIPVDRTVQKEGERSKIQEFMLQRMWNMKCVIIPVIIGATRIVQGLKKNLKAIPRNVQ
jgi:hypothetical protein